MNVVLISINISKDPYPVYPVGMCMVASALIRNGHNVFIYDCLRDGASSSTVNDFVSTCDADVVGISIRNVRDGYNCTGRTCIDYASELVSYIRERCDVTFVLGGSGFSLLPQHAMELTNADYGIVGEGEDVFINLLKQLECGESPNAILSVDDYTDVGVIHPPYYDKELVKYYNDQCGIIGVQTKRGCNKKCVYCSYPLIEGSNIRSRIMSEVVDDILFLQNECDVDTVWLVDAVFNDSYGYYKDLVDVMIERNVKIKWYAYFSPTKDLDDDIIRKMKYTGLTIAELGVDSTSDIVLAGLKKQFKWIDIVRVNVLFNESDIITVNFFNFGGPNETLATVKVGVERIQSLKNSLHIVDVGYNVIPNTELATSVDKLSGIMTDMYCALDEDELTVLLCGEFSGDSNVAYMPIGLGSSAKYMISCGHIEFVYNSLINGVI